MSTTLAEEDTKPRLITHQEVVGQLANWAIRQHPYGRPEGLFDLAEVISGASVMWPDGVSSLHMWKVTGSRQIEMWLRETLKDHPILTAWNTPRSGHTQQIVATSRYWGPKPEDDFIDIDALFMNVARSVWRAAGT